MAVDRNVQRLQNSRHVPRDELGKNVRFFIFFCRGPTFREARMSQLSKKWAPKANLFLHEEILECEYYTLRRTLWFPKTTFL
jgi:hypothetical protein